MAVRGALALLRVCFARNRPGSARAGIVRAIINLHSAGRAGDQKNPFF